MYAIPHKRPSCHNVNWRSWKCENTHPDPFNSNTFMKFSSCRLTSSSSDVASAAYTAIISEVRVTGGCVTTLGSTGLVIGGRGAVSPAYQYCSVSQHLPLTCIDD